MIPILRVNVVDMIMAHKLNARAQSEAAKGDFSRASSTWHEAMQRNPGNLAILRASARNMVNMPDALFENRPEALALATWLLEASKTNHSDVLLATQVFDLFKAPEQIVSVTNQKELRESPDFLEKRFVALLRLGRIQQVQEELSALPSPVKTRSDAQLFQSALSGLLDAPGSRSGRDLLIAAMHNPRESALATLLLYWVSLHQEDVATAKETLRRMVETGRNQIQDHLSLWKLLLKRGYTSEASKLANEKVPDPVTGAQASQLVGTLVNIDRVDVAIQVLEREIPRHTQNVELWILKAEILAKSGEWRALRSAALKMREVLAQNRDATALSLLFEAQGCYELGIPKEVEQNLDQIQQLPFIDPSLALYAAQLLQKLRAFEMVQTVLKPCREKLEKNPVFWSLLFDASFSAKASGELLSAGKGGWELEPDKPETINRYVVALILTREQPEKALTLSRQLKAMVPRATGATINLAQACLLNSRLQEAAQLLKEIDDRQITPTERNPFWLASAELAILQKDPGKAKVFLNHLHVEDLFPEQVRWLENARNTITR